MFDISKERYDYIIDNVIFNEPKKEREIFDLLVKGYNAKEIGNIISTKMAILEHCSESTISKELNKLKKKIMKVL